MMLTTAIARSPMLSRRLGSAAPPGKQLACAGCAGMFPYMLGVVAAMQDDFGDALHTEVNAVGGASAGTFGALLLATGISARALHEDAHLALVARVRADGGPLFRWNDRVYDAFLAYLDAVAPAAHATASGRLHVSLSEVTLRGVTPKKRSAFASNADLVDDMIASSFVPFAYGARPPFAFHQSRVDGGLYVDASVQDPKPTPRPVDACPRLVLHHRMFRRDLPFLAPISDDAAVVDARFHMGHDDAKRGRDVFAAFLGA